jgi:hypothetical protein
MEPEGSLQRFQEPTIDLYLEPDELADIPSYFSKIHFNIILSSFSQTLSVCVCFS